MPPPPFPLIVSPVSTGEAFETSIPLPHEWEIVLLVTVTDDDWIESIPVPYGL